MSLSSQTYRKKIETHFRRLSAEAEKSESSLYSEEPNQVELEANEKIFSFSQTFTNIQQNEKIIQDKTNSLNRIKNLQEQLKLCKNRSSLWEKAKVEIMNLNKYLKLSSVSLGCSDSLLMKEFFESINELLIIREEENKDQKLKFVEKKKKENELFEKIVESNMKNYELQQRILHYQSQIQKLKNINNNLRQKLRVQGTQRSSQIRQIHEITSITIQQKDTEFKTLQERYNEVKQQTVNYENEIQNLKRQLEQKQFDLTETKQHNEQYYLQCQALKKQIQCYQYDQNTLQQNYLRQRQETQKLSDERSYLINQLERYSYELNHLRKVIEQIRSSHYHYLKQFEQVDRDQKIRLNRSLSPLNNRDEARRRDLKSNEKFAINRRTKKLLSSINQSSLTPKINFN